MKITYYQRKPLSSQFSIERVFEAVREGLPEEVTYKVFLCPFQSKGIIRRMLNCLMAIFSQGDINHITGDVHYLALLLSRKKTVLTIHDCRSLHRLKGLRRKIFKLFWFDLPIKRSSIVTVISSFTKQELLELVQCPEEKIIVVPDPVTKGFTFKPKRFNEDNPVIPQIGTDSNKNLDRIVQACEGLDVTLDIVGKLSNEQRTLLEENGIRYSNSYNLSDHEIKQKYESCDIVVFASLYEGFGMPKRRLKLKGLNLLMYHANLIGGFIARVAGHKSICWGIHHSTLEAGKSARSTIFVSKLCALLSPLVPAKIICCSQRAAEVHQQLGYCKNKFVVIPNGYDLNQFSPDQEAGQRLRSEWGISDDIPLLGMVARYDPQKNHANLIQALGILKKSGTKSLCVLAGTGMYIFNNELVKKIKDEDVEDRVLLLGRRSDIPEVMNAIDVHILSSSGEAFPNVLTEAMSCGTPCITTDVGDAALIVGETGWVIHPEDPEALAGKIYGAIEEMQKSEHWEKKKLAVRKRIYENFRIGVILEAYVQEWREVCSQ